jgi:hypothetical protein
MAITTIIVDWAIFAALTSEVIVEVIVIINLGFR